MVLGFIRLEIKMQDDQRPSRGVAGLEGGEVKIGIRPEAVRIGLDGWLDARVVARQFLGDSVVLKLLLGDGTTLLADQRTSVEDAPIGTEVRIGWPTNDVHLFPPDAEEATR